MPQKDTAPQTILHLIDTTGPGGAEDVFIHLATELNSTPWRSLAVIRGEGYVADTLRKNGIEPIILDSKGSFNVKFIWQLLKLIRVYNVQVIQSHLLGSNVYAAIVGVLTRTPVVATYHGMVDVSPNERFKRLKLWFMRNGISNFVAVSRSLANKIQEHELLVPERTTVIYNGIQTALYNGEKQTLLREKLGIDEDIVLFGTLGNIRKSKRYDLLLEAIDELADIKRRFHVVIAGDPKAKIKQQLDAVIRDKNITNVSFIGFVENTPEYLQGLDAFLLTSDAEGFSISTIEAMASGLPVIATRCGGPEEIIENDSQGQLVAIDPKAIGAAMRSLIADAPASILRNQVAVERVTNTFSAEAMVAAYNDLYKKAQLRGF
ncbi:glycosyltransferase family 4 protein [Alteromonas sp. ASW11-36]|uniref:Glycosyltransferase family 4 protein n=1 Tax=Alteromonas arenosi TaxID=3055817 RepID=A0ABT7STX6_9ALTE|nr:glycosyltransferase family 4 protein [Alteromonas sp. ASW11-36]MDM7859642.1 glycosyltransferase family 4 protein [Alteromonas sp. ASW11-36]